jgi:hypothetical protein
MQDTCIYQIEIHGRIDQDDLNTFSPLQVEIKQVNQDTTQFTVSTDQSGLIGLMRYLHGLGLVFSSVRRESIRKDNSK